jgi:hypothetical protein
MTSIDHLMTQADERMAQADQAGDLSAWIKHYMIWLFLYSLKNRLPWPAN